MSMSGFVGWKESQFAEGRLVSEEKEFDALCRIANLFRDAPTLRREYHVSVRLTLSEYDELLEAFEDLDDARESLRRLSVEV